MVSRIVQQLHLVQKLTFNHRLIGISCMIFFVFVRIRIKRTNNGSNILLYLITINFIACTASLAVDVSARQTTGSLGVYMAANALYTCIDFISQVILVNFLAYDSVSTADASGSPFSLFSIKDIPMLDHVAPTMGYGPPDPVNTCILRC
jgi:hypothetical protein